MPTTNNNTAPVTFDRDQLLTHEGFRSLTSRERGAFLLTLCLLTDTDPASPLHNCLCAHGTPMTLEEWGREVGEAHRAPAKRLWKRFTELGLLEYHEHQDRQYARVCLSAPPTPASHSSHTSHTSHSTPPPVEAPAPEDQPLTSAQAFHLGQEFVRLTGHRTSLTDWMSRIQSLGRTAEGAQALRALLTEAQAEITGPTPPESPRALLETRLNEACRTHYVCP